MAVGFCGEILCFIRRSSGDLFLFFEILIELLPLNTNNAHLVTFY